ncbi:MAG: hypothetical protein ABIR70_09695 [Bryobacteraceae bacterium]
MIDIGGKIPDFCVQTSLLHNYQRPLFFASAPDKMLLEDVGKLQRRLLYRGAVS